MSEDGETVTLRRFSGQFSLAPFPPDDWMRAHQGVLRTGIVIDIETTGLDKKLDSVIEVGLRRFTFNSLDGQILRVGESYSALQDPGKPLSQEIVALTGLTDQVLRGKSIDWETVGHALSDAEIIVAHNAAFDRPFIDRHVKGSTNKLWGCSLRQIDWNRKGFSSHKLEVLSIYHGFFTDSHRALNDADALLNLLSMSDDKSSNLHELLQNSRRPWVRAVAAGSPFESKDLLRIRGYRWDTMNRVWKKMLVQDDVSQEVAWLESNVYCGPFLGKMEAIPIVDNFK